MLRVTNTEELMDAVRQARCAIALDNGDYELDAALVKNSLHLVGAHTLGTRVHVLGTLPIFWRSRVQTLTFDLEHGRVNCDFAALSVFDQVDFVSRLPLENHYGKWFKDVAYHGGVGVELTAANDGDSSYGVSFVNRCGFVGFDVAMDVGAPGKKGTVAWFLKNPEFSMCEYAIRGVRLGDWNVEGGNFQVCQTALEFQGHSNRFYSHFERSVVNVHILPNSFENFIGHDSRQAFRIVDEGTGTQFAQRRVMNVGADVVR